MFERYTERSRRVLVLAQESARLLNHSFIGTEHVLLGLINEKESLAALVLDRLGLTAEKVTEVIKEVVGMPTTSPINSPPFTPRTKKLLERALQESLEQGVSYVAPEHLLLALVHDTEGAAAQVIVKNEVELVAIRREVLAVVEGRNTEVTVTRMGRRELESAADWLLKVGPFPAHHPATPLLAAMKRAAQR